MIQAVAVFAHHISKIIVSSSQAKQGSTNLNQCCLVINNIFSSFLRVVRMGNVEGFNRLVAYCSVR
jgi:hypothetical protein